MPNNSTVGKLCAGLRLRGLVTVSSPTVRPLDSQETVNELSKFEVLTVRGKAGPS